MRHAHAYGNYSEGARIMGSVFMLPHLTQPLLRLLLAALAVQSILIAGQNWSQAKDLAGAGTVQHDGAPVASQQGAPARVF